VRHTISIWVENKFGVLARVAGLFSGRGFNIDSLAVGETLDPTASRMTVVVRGDDTVLDQISKQLNKLVDVIKVQDFSCTDSVQRGLVLVKVTAKRAQDQIRQVADDFGARIVHAGGEDTVVEMTGEEDKIQEMLNLLKPFGIKEVVRTGMIAIACGQTKST